MRRGPRSEPFAEQDSIMGQRTDRSYKLDGGPDDDPISAFGFARPLDV
jgi:hypothetical protein